MFLCLKYCINDKKDAMKTKYLIMLATVIIFSGFAASESNYLKDTDFSGEWVLNSDESELGERSRRPKTLTISQDKAIVSVKSIRTGRNGEENEVTETFNLNGEEVTSGRGGATKSTATWEGKNLSISSSRTMNRNGNSMVIKGTQTWELSNGGKTLTISGTNSTPRGENTFVAVYNKK